MDKLANSPYDGFMARMYPNQDNQAREYAVFDNSKVKMLEDVLANDDMAVNNPDIMMSKLAPEEAQGATPQYKRIYHGTNATFTDFDEKLPSVWFTDNADDIANTGLSNRGGKLNIMERDLPSDLKLADWDLADKYTKQQLIDRGYDGIAYDGSGTSGNDTYYEIFNPNKTLKKVDKDTHYSKAAPIQSLEKTLANGDAEINRVGSANVAPVDPATLPESLRMANDYINKGYIKDIEETIGKPYDKMTDGDFLEYSLSTRKPEDRELFRQIIDDMVKDGSTTYKKYAESAAGNKYLRGIREAKLPDMDSESLVNYLANNRHKLSDSFTKSADAELSDRLGIGRSNTLMMDNIAGGEDAYGVYNPANSTMSLNTNAFRDGDGKISVAGHERLHSFQTESKMNRYDPEVIDAYKDLRKELRASKAFKNKQEIKDYWGESVDYYRNNDEQEARMLQQYLENRGFTGKAPKSSNKVYHEAGVREFDNDKINPAFDKFMDKLRDMSRRGIALPALTALFGGGALMANQQKDKEEVR
jgi:hypothetical protein